MVKKIVDIEATTQKIIDAMNAMPPPPNADEYALKQWECQKRAGVLHAAHAKFFMEEMNLGTDPFIVFMALINVTSGALLNLTNNTEETREWAKRLKLAVQDQYRDSESHFDVHLAVDAMSLIMHKRITINPTDDDFQTNSIGAVEIPLKDVGDA